MPYIDTFNAKYNKFLQNCQYTLNCMKDPSIIMYTTTFDLVTDH